MQRQQYTHGGKTRVEQTFGSFRIDVLRVLSDPLRNIILICINDTTPLTHLEGVSMSSL